MTKLADVMKFADPLTLKWRLLPDYLGPMPSNVSLQFHGHLHVSDVGFSDTCFGLMTCRIVRS